MKEDTEIVVAGGGVIGLCIAVALQSSKREVTLVERDEPGSGASSGNAGVLATYACVPLGTPGVLKSLPQLLFDRASPLSISPSALPSLLPWLLRFARSSLQGRARRSASFLSILLKNSLAAYAPLLEDSGATGLLRRDGVIHLFRSKRDVDAIAWDFGLRAASGIRQTLLDGADLNALEPALPPHYACGILYPDAAHLTDPSRLMRLLAQAFVARGGRIVRTKITGLDSSRNRVLLKCDGLALSARTAVVTLGAWSNLLARQLGDRIPLETERGYHLEFEMAAPLLSRPVCPIELGFYLTPMTGRLRAAGTVELSNLQRPLNPRRLQLIQRGAQHMFPQLGTAQSSWLGFRPSLPDSLPVIGRSPRANNVIYAFGHGHLGVTLAAETAHIVSNLISGRAENGELLNALSPARFC